MKKRGKVLREPNSGPGLVMIEGQQFRFSVDTASRSQARPKPGVNVEVELDENLQVIGIAAIPDSQIGPQHAQETPAEVVMDGRIARRQLAARLVALALIAAALLLMGWFFLKN